jgi:hypothetical protein
LEDVFLVCAAVEVAFDKILNQGLEGKYQILKGNLVSVGYPFNEVTEITLVHDTPSRVIWRGPGFSQMSQAWEEIWESCWLVFKASRD